MTATTSARIAVRQRLFEYLTERANDPRTASAFLSLVGKAMPVQVTGEGGGALGMTLVITGVPATPQS